LTDQQKHKLSSFVHTTERSEKRLEKKEREKKKTEEKK